MYKDKQKQTNKERQRRYRAKLKGVTHKPERNAQDVTSLVDVLARIEAGIVHPPPLPAEPPISSRGVLTLAAGGWFGPLTKERQTGRKGFNE